MRESERRAIGALVVIIVVLAVLSLYGCLSGSWDEKPAPSGYGTVP
jgi:hypothetical protein